MPEILPCDQATGAQLLWRCVGNRQLPVHRMLDDDSYLSAIGPIRVGRRKAAARVMVVRVIEYALPGLKARALPQQKNRSVVQCVFIEHDDKPWDARVGENLKRVGKRARFSQISIYSTTPGVSRN